MQKLKLSTAIAKRSPKLLVYGDSGVGKTTLVASLEGRILVLSAESGLLSLAQFADRADVIDVVEIATLAQLRECYAELRASCEYDWIVLDSVSEIAEVVLADEKAKTKDPRQAYGALADSMTAIMRAFRDLDAGVYFSAKLAKTKDETTGRVSYGIGMPGAKLGDALPYLFDEVFRLVVIDEDDGDGGRVQRRYLQTAADSRSVAKDRSGKLDALEPADLGAIVAKIRQ